MTERKQDMKQTADSPGAPASFTPSLRAERYDEVVTYDDAGTAKPPQRTYEKVWQGGCGPDFTIEDGESSHRVRPVRLRIRWFQDGAAAPRWNSIEVTGHELLPDESLGRLPIREIWTSYHAELGQVPDWFLQFVSANPPELRTVPQS
ncbi:hypothetical protein [Streptomyces marianii]|uniref:Uncharacterized protein n=1 Tax=Streptomyces marianii TaxID=1817406 RepID=A0A5R9DUK3_9ACTN|nr:hypothetical protein [Streptomyces marianii]TLQ39461.1 hypothetical protein FEF34_39540 [Streptomyces marianii]